MTDLFPSTITTVKALSLWQPWASLMAAGYKLHETRHWATDYRGKLAIHAAKTLDLAGAPEELCIAAWGPRWRDLMPLGAIVAIGRLTSCRPTRDVRTHITRADVAAGNFAPGRYAWEIEDVAPLREPIPLAGRQGLFNWPWPEDIAQRLRPPVDHWEQCRQIGWL